MTKTAEWKTRQLTEDNMRLAAELAEVREVLRAIRRGEVDALVSSEADSLYAIQLTALAIDKAETYIDSLVLLLKQLCITGNWQYGEAWAASSDRQFLRRTNAWYGGCSDAIRLRECIVRLLFDGEAESTLTAALQSGQPQWTYAEELPAGARATAVGQCGFQTGVALPVAVGGRLTAVLWLWKRERQALDRPFLARAEEIIAECAPLVQRKREEEILRFTVDKLDAAVRERTREIARLTRERQPSRKQLEPAAGLVQTAGAGFAAALLPTLLDSMAEGVLVADSTGQIVQSNAAAQQILGEDPPGSIPLALWPDIYGLHHADKTTRLDHDDQPLVKALRGETVERMEIYLRNGSRPDGRTLEMSARPLAVEGGGPLGAVVVFEDVTQRRSIDDGRLQRVLAQRDTLLREVHHRIKNNLAAVVELMRHHAREEPNFQKVMQQVEPQLRAIAAVHGLKSGTESTVRLGPLIKSVADNTILLHGATVEVAVADPLRGLKLREEESVPLALVLNELLVNARKHGTQDRLEVQAARDGESIVITVANNVARGASAPAIDAPGAQGHGIALVRSLLPHDRATLQFQQSGERVSAIVRLAPDVFGPDSAPEGERPQW